MSGSQPKEATVATELASWVNQLSFDDLPADVVRVAKECVRDSIGCAILGSSRARVTAFEAVIRRLPTGGEATVIMAPWRADVFDAAFINAIYTHGCEIDDGMTGAGGHPGSVTVPVALALGEKLHRSGRDVITAVVAGYDVLHRATAPIHPKFIKRGFQGTGIGGPFGATAVAGKMMGSSSDTLAEALAIVGCYASGLCEYDQSGGETKRLYAGRSARAGIESVELATAGVDGPLTIFEGIRGVYAGFAFENQIDESRALAGLGTDYRIFRHKVKPYSSVGTAHGPIDAIAALIDTPLAVSDVAAITVKLQPGRRAHGGAIQVPWSLISAQFSVAFSVAIRVLYGRNQIDLYEDPAVRTNPDVVALCNKVNVIEMTEDDENVTDNTVVTLELADGTKRTHVQHAAPGTPDNPLTPERLRQKFFDVTEGHIPESVQEEINDTVESLEKLDDLDGLVRLLRQSS